MTAGSNEQVTATPEVREGVYVKADPADFRCVQGAWIHRDARLAEDVVVEPGALIGKDVEIGAGSWIGAGAVIYGPTKIGEGNEIHGSAVLGGAPQDLQYKGEPTRLEIGDRNVIREGATIHRASTKGDGVTRVGNENFLMVHTHIGHDVVLEDRVVTANGVSIGGHSHVHSHVNLSSGVGIMQFVTIGRHAFAAGMAGTRKDLEPFLCHDVASGTELQVQPKCVNEVGLKRAGFAPEVIKNLRSAYKVLFLRDGRKDIDLARQELARRSALCPEVEELLDFTERTQTSRFGRHLNG